MSDSYIFRRARKEGYTVIPNAMITDTRLSWEARGLLVYLLSRPRDWTVRKTDLERQSKANDFVVSRILSELTEHRYIYRERTQNEEGKFEWVTFVFDEPIPQSTTDGKTGDIVSNKEQNNTTGATKKDVLDAMVEYNRKPSGLEGYPEDVKDVLSAFVEVFRRDPAASEKAFWIKTARKWKEIGVKPGDVKRMYAHSREQGLAIKSPESITFAYDELRREPKKEYRRAD